MLNYGIAVWSSELNKLLPGPNIDTLIDAIEESKRITGGFHPHVANRIFSTIMADWKYSNYWKIPTARVDNLWKIRISIIKLVGGRWRTFSAEHAAFNKEPAITECALSMLQQFFLARIIPSDIYYRRQPTSVGPTEVEAAADSIVVAVPEAASSYEADTLIDTVDYVDTLTDTESDSDTVVEASPEVESEFSEEMKIETIVNSSWKKEFNWGNLVATHFKGQYFAVALSVPGKVANCKTGNTQGEFYNDCID